VPANGLDILDQGLGVVARQGAQIVLNSGFAPPAAALIQADRQELRSIERLRYPRPRPAPGPPWRYSTGTPAGFPDVSQ
jgi:hypothetical protein